MFDEFKNAFARYNNGHVQLIIINVVVFLLVVLISVPAKVLDLDGFFNFVFRMLAIPPRFGEFITRPWTIVTYAFVHDWRQIFHILGNMIGLYWFGKLIIEYLGNDKLIAIYVLGALAGGAIYLLMFNTVPFFIERANDPAMAGMVGASAAVFAVMVAAATLLPDYSFFLLFFGPVKIKYIAAFFIVVSYMGTIGSNEGGNLAHLGGALIGFIYTKQLKVGVNWGGWITSTIAWIKSLFEPKQRVKVTYRKEPDKQAPKKGVGKASQDEIDAILDKISDKGYESLTKDEKEKLFNASKK